MAGSKEEEEAELYIMVVLMVIVLNSKNCDVNGYANSKGDEGMLLAVIFCLL